MGISCSTLLTGIPEVHDPVISTAACSGTPVKAVWGRCMFHTSSSQSSHLLQVSLSVLATKMIGCGSLIMSLIGSSGGIPDHGRCNPCHFDLFQHLIAVFLKGFHSAQYLFCHPHGSTPVPWSLYYTTEDKDRLVFNIVEFEWDNVAPFLSASRQSHSPGSEVPV